jgi:DNA-binding YbaB/EbfC family protein
MMQQPDIQKMMREMQKAQQALEKVQAELAHATVEGSAGGGAVKVTCTGSLEFTGVKIKPEAIDPNDAETLEDLVLAAIKDAADKAKKLGEQKMGNSFGGLQIPGF